MTKEENFVAKNGWAKKKGYKIKLDIIRESTDESWDAYFIEKESLSDYVEEVEYWTNDEYEETVFEDIDSVIEYLENDLDIKFEE